MKLRRTILISSLLLAFAALSPVAAQGDTKGTGRPLKGRLTTTVVSDAATGTANVDGTFRLTHLGKGTSHQTTTTVSVAGTTAVNAGTATYVAANGDKLFTSVAGRVTFTATGSEATFVDTITGGTGRFDDASGTFTRTGVAVRVSVVGSIITQTGTASARGQISY
jgi:hypothetical protein